MKVTFCYVITYIIEALILWQYCSRLFYPKHSKHIKALLLAGLYSLLFFIVLLQLAWLNIVAFLIVNFIYIWVIYQVKYSTALFHAAITTTIMGMSELIVFSIRTYFTSNFFAEYDYLKNLIILGIFSKTLYFIILQTIVRLFNTKHKSYSKTSFLLTGVPIITVFIMMTLFATTLLSELTLLLDWMISVSAILLLSTNMFIFGIYDYTQRKEAELAALRLQLQKEYDAAEFRKAILQESESKSILIHDIKKHLMTLADLSAQSESQRVTSYISTLLNSSSLRTSVRVSDNDMLNVILCRYINTCYDKHISMQTDIRSKCLNFMSDEDMTALFCNLLDNAMEAAYRIPEGYIEVTASRRERTPYTLITVINSCRQNPIDEQGNLMIFKPNKELHGFGMKSVARIVRKYLGEMHYYYDDETSTFHVIMLVQDMRI